MRLSTTVSALIFISCLSMIMAAMVGGISDNEKSSNDEVQGMVQSLNSTIKGEALQLLAGSNGGANDTAVQQFNAANLTALAYKTQVVAGTNYFVKTKIGNFIFHVRIYRDLKNNYSVTKVIGPKEASDKIEYF